MLIANPLDKNQKYEKTGLSLSTNFLNIRELKLITDILKSLKAEFSVYAPHEDCEKHIVIFGDEKSFIITYKINGEFKHADVLGALFNNGFDNTTIGDIFVESNYIYLTNLTRFNKMLEQQLESIKNIKIKLIEVDEIVLTKQKFEDIQIIVPSYRLDSIISKIACVGRNESNKIISQGLVFVNYQEIKKNDYIVRENDIISIRRFGKFKIDKEILTTKKNNYLVNIKKYA